MPRPIAIAASVTVPHPPEALWPFVTNTDRMDRAVGLPPAHFTHVPRAEGGEENRGEYRLLGRPLVRWIEHPFAWEWPRRYAVVREYQRGPLVRYYGGAELLPEGDGTRIRVFSEFTPRHWRVAPLVRYWLGPLTIRRACRQYQAIAAYLAGRATDPFPDLARARGPVDTARLEAQLARLRDEDAPPTPLAELGRLLAEAADEDVAGMRPLELAARWGTEPRETLETFLLATLGGLLEVRWELLCPGCRGVKATAAHLRDLESSGRCSACNLHFVANVDEAIEARFYPNPAIRRAEVGTYCVGGPTNTPHRLAHRPLDAGAAHAWDLDLPPGHYTLHSPQSSASAALVAEESSGGTEVPVTIATTAMTPAAATLRAGRVTLRVTNAMPYPATIALDDARWARQGVTPGYLLLLPAFHDFFSAEALAPGVELAIGRVGLLFTDLAGSTALYERAGDARAFRLVGEHFAILQRAIEEGGGALIKTIGDAVMAAFPDGRAALSAALAIQRDIRALDTRGLADPARLVKIGVHAGACYAVTLNERLDYFGTAVNLAARAQSEATGGEIVATAAAFAEGGEALVAALGLRGAPIAVTVKGLSAPVDLCRIACHDVAGTVPAH